MIKYPYPVLKKYHFLLLKNQGYGHMPKNAGTVPVKHKKQLPRAGAGIFCRMTQCFAQKKNAGVREYWAANPDKKRVLV